MGSFHAFPKELEAQFSNADKILEVVLRKHRDGLK